MPNRSRLFDSLPRSRPRAPGIQRSCSAVVRRSRPSVVYRRKRSVMSKKSHPSAGKASKPAVKFNGFKQQFNRGTPLSRRPPRQPGR